MGLGFGSGCGTRNFVEVNALLREVKGCLKRFRRGVFCGGSLDGDNEVDGAGEAGAGCGDGQGVGAGGGRGDAAGGGSRGACAGDLAGGVAAAGDREESDEGEGEQGGKAAGTAEREKTER